MAILRDFPIQTMHGLGWCHIMTPGKFAARIMDVNPKTRGKTPKVDGENNGKAYFCNG